MCEIQVKHPILEVMVPGTVNPFGYADEDCKRPEETTRVLAKGKKPDVGFKSLAKKWAKVLLG